MFCAIFAMIADKAGGAAYGGHNDRTITGFRIAQEDAKNANWHMHMLLYGLILLLMDDVSRPRMSHKFASMCWMRLRPSASASRPS